MGLGSRLAAAAASGNLQEGITPPTRGSEKPKAFGGGTLRLRGPPSRLLPITIRISFLTLAFPETIITSPMKAHHTPRTRLGFFAFSFGA